MTIISTYSGYTEYPNHKFSTFYFENITGEGNTAQFKYNIPVWGDCQIFPAIRLQYLAILEIGLLYLALCDNYILIIVAITTSYHVFLQQTMLVSQ